MLTGLALLVLATFSGAVFWAASRRAAGLARSPAAPVNSLPFHHGAYAAVWTAVPAALVLLVAGLFGNSVETALVKAQLPAAVRALEASDRQVFLDDALAVARGGSRSETPYSPDLEAALKTAASEAHAIDVRIRLIGLGSAVVLALAGAAWGLSQIRAPFRARAGVEKWIQALLLLCSVTAVFTTVGIVASLVWESWRFFQAVPPLAFLFGMEWDPQSAMYADQVVSEGAFGAIPLFVGTFLIMLIAMTVAAPVGLFAAIYLSEYASATSRAIIKPLLEILAGVPTVVYGFFAALTVGPLFRSGFNALGAMLVQERQVLEQFDVGLEANPHAIGGRHRTGLRRGGVPPARPRRPPRRSRLQRRGRLARLGRQGRRGHPPPRRARRAARAAARPMMARLPRPSAAGSARALRRARHRCRCAG